MPLAWPFALAALLALPAAPGVARAGTRRKRTPWRLRELRNFRDANALAGLPRGRIYRSDDPRHNPFHSCEKLRTAGIRTIIKLNGFQHTVNYRRRPVWRTGPCGIPELVVSLPYSKTRGGHGITIYQLGRHRGLSAKRRRVVRYMERQISLLFKELTRLRESDLPVLVHCSVGRDRTGIVLAILQRLAGASRRGVEADYVASAATVGYTSVVSLRRVLRRVRPLRRFLRRQLGLTSWELRKLRRFVRGPRRRARPAPRPRTQRFGPR